MIHCAFCVMLFAADHNVHTSYCSVFQGRAKGFVSSSEFLITWYDDSGMSCLSVCLSLTCGLATNLHNCRRDSREQAESSLMREGNEWFNAFVYLLFFYFNATTKWEDCSRFIPRQSSTDNDRYETQQRHDGTIYSWLIKSFQIFCSELELLT
jgi:hypothetical protein